MSNDISRAAAAMGRKGGTAKTTRKLAAVRKNLEKARKNRWKAASQKSA